LEALNPPWAAGALAPDAADTALAAIVTVAVAPATVVVLAVIVVVAVAVEITGALIPAF